MGNRSEIEDRPPGGCVIGRHEFRVGNDNNPTFLEMTPNYPHHAIRLLPCEQQIEGRLREVDVHRPQPTLHNTAPSARVAGSDLAPAAGSPAKNPPAAGGLSTHESEEA